MNAKLRKLRKQIERAGGQVMFPDDMPDDVAEMFVKMIADCPDCAAAMMASPASKSERSRQEH
ncbi:MAG: hypothetical protein QOK37_1468 [Thermoanaerobaculia bacterium]|jgi:hypothetical protein|nr:hypothetical protein [Thermoanaerobaculia bacterium]